MPCRAGLAQGCSTACSVAVRWRWAEAKLVPEVLPWCAQPIACVCARSCVSTDSDCSLCPQVLPTACCSLPRCLSPSPRLHAASGWLGPCRAERPPALRCCCLPGLPPRPGPRRSWICGPPRSCCCGLWWQPLRSWPEGCWAGASTPTPGPCWCLPGRRRRRGWPGSMASSTWAR